MKIHFRFDDTDGEHTHTTLYIGGRMVGQLIMSPEEAVWLDHILGKGAEAINRSAAPVLVDYITSGQCPGPRDTDATTSYYDPTTKT